MDEYHIFPGANLKRKHKLAGTILFWVCLFAVYFVVMTIFINRKDPDSLTEMMTENGLSTRVAITESGFIPATIEIKVGTTVEFINLDDEIHGVASDPFPTKDALLGFDSVENLPERGTYTFKFNEVGSWGYYDPIHPFDFHGEVVVID